MMAASYENGREEFDYRAFFEFATVGMKQLDVKSGRFMMVNPEYCRMTGYSLEELKGMTFLDITHPEDHEREKEAFRCLAEGSCEIYDTEKRYLHKEGKLVWAHVRAKLKHEEGKPPVCISSVYDITGRKRTEEELRRAMQSLEEVNRHLEWFNAIAAHDLLAPLRYMRMSIEFLDQRGEPLPQDVAEHMSFIKEHAVKLERLVHDLLELCRIKERRDPLEYYVDLNQTAWESLEVLKGAIRERNAEVHVEKLPVIHGAPSLMRSLFHNLLSNAIKYCCRNNETPQVRVYSRKTDSSIEICFQDNGIGLEPSFTEQIFQPFHKFHGGPEGSGLGLAICKEIVHRHGGEIDVESKPNEGSVFIVKLPPQTVPKGKRVQETA